MFTRRCSERRFFLRPDARTNNAFWYCLGWAAQKHGMVLHAAVAMSNHVHVVATDPRGTYPDFLRDFHGLLARVVNAARGRWEHFWDAKQASAVVLEDDASQSEKVAYVLGNPVGLVNRASEWPGATALHAIVESAAVVASRPDHFFRDEGEGGAMPESIEVGFVPPPALVNCPRSDYVRSICEKLAKIEEEAAGRHRAAGTCPLGVRRILGQRWEDCPGDSEPRGELSPRVACRDKCLRSERMKANKVFQDLYRAAFAQFRAGAQAIFPFGTWLMRFRAAIQVSTA